MCSCHMLFSFSFEKFLSITCASRFALIIKMTYTMMHYFFNNEVGITKSQKQLSLSSSRICLCVFFKLTTATNIRPCLILLCFLTVCKQKINFFWKTAVDDTCILFGKKLDLVDTTVLFFFKWVMKPFQLAFIIFSMKFCTCYKSSIAFGMETMFLVSYLWQCCIVIFQFLFLPCAENNFGFHESVTCK